MLVYILVDENGVPQAVYNDEGVADALIPQIEARLNVKLTKHRRKLNLQADLVGNLDVQK